MNKQRLTSWRRVTPRPALLFATLLACACNTRVEPAYSPSDSHAESLAGLFVPGSKLGIAPDAGRFVGDGGDTSGLSSGDKQAIQDAIDQGGSQDRCLFSTAQEGTAATLSVEFGTVSYGGFYAPANCGAVWIEDGDGQYVANVNVWAKLRQRNIFVWNARRCKADPVQADIVSSATLSNHETSHQATWDGKDRQGKVVPDGSYVLNIEVTEDEFDYGRRSQYPFEKGPNAFDERPDDQGSVTGLHLLYSPEP